MLIIGEIEKELKEFEKARFCLETFSKIGFKKSFLKIYFIYAGAVLTLLRVGANYRPLLPASCSILLLDLSVPDSHVQRGSILLFDLSVPDSHVYYWREPPILYFSLFHLPYCLSSIEN